MSIRNIPDDGDVRRLEPGRFRPISLSFSPDDRYLLTQGPRGEIGAFRVSDGKATLTEPLTGASSYTFSPDSRFLALSLQGRARCFDLENGRCISEWKLPGSAFSMAFRPDGRALALGFGGVEGVAVFDPKDGSLLTRLPVGELTGHAVAWDPDGRLLAVSGTEPRIQLWDVAARVRLATLPGHVQRVTDLAFHPAGGLLASYSWDGTLRLWDPATGRPLLQLPLTIDSRLRFSPDGRWLAAGRYGDQLELLEVTPSQVYRTLASDGGLGRGAYTPADVSPDGRLLAVGSVEDGAPGVRIWDLASGRQLAALPDGVRFVFFDGPWMGQESDSGPGAALLTSGSDGLLRWPLTADGPDGRNLRLGRPRVLSPYRRAWFARPPGGAVVGASTEEGGANRILDMQSGAVRWDLGKLPEGGEIRAVSPDGRWAASSGWHSTRVRLWDLSTGQSVHQWGLGKRNFVEFSPDSRFLVISRENEFTFWDLKTLRPTRRLVRDVAHFPGHVAFSPDGSLTALEMQPGVIHLLVTETGRTVARLEDPYGDRATWQGFTPDGAGLVVVSAYASAVHVWDLRALRSQLKNMRLDWDWPEFGPEPPPSARIEALTFDYLPVEDSARGKIERFRQALRARPESAYACNSLAWAYLTAPGSLRDVGAALALAEKAVKRMPGETSFRNTLGLAYYRSGRYQEAAEAFRTNLKTPGNSLPSLDLYFLAMSLHKLGDAAHARDLYGWAANNDPALSDLPSRSREELDQARAEAEEVLGIRMDASISQEAPRQK
ncbi:MAG: CDC27 family protein [Isosphaeraceae bacterium]